MSPDKTDPLFGAGSVTPSPSAPGSGKSPAGFDTFMKESPKSAAAATAAPSSVPLPTAPPTAASILAQTTALQQGMTTVQGQISDPNLSLKRSQAHLVRNKLGDANTSIRAAGTRLGVETPPMTSTGSGPVARFLNYLSDGQNQLAAVQTQLQTLSKSPTGMNAADLLYIQLKMNQAQQEIEYSSTLLGKVMDSLKTILNTPL